MTLRPWSRESLVAGAAAAFACGSPVESVSRQASPVIDGTPAPELTGVVAISHEDSSFLCAGTLIHPRLVVTALHCTVIPVPDGADQPLDSIGFRVGFGPTDSHLTFVPTSSVVRPEGSSEVQQRVDSGEDVALIWLAEPAPEEATIHEVDFGFIPQSGDVLTIAGYGRSSVTVPQAGEKLASDDDALQFDEETGIFRLQGNGACEGDSGGPVFFGSDRRWIGSISRTAYEPSEPVEHQIANECQGFTDAATVANPVVAGLIRHGLGEAAERDACATQASSLGGAGGRGAQATAQGTSDCWEADMSDNEFTDDDVDVDQDDAGPDPAAASGGASSKAASGESPGSGGCAWSSPSHSPSRWPLLGFVAFLLGLRLRRPRLS